jgi:hypothetical protein
LSKLCYLLTACVTLCAAVAVGAEPPQSVRDEVAQIVVGLTHDSAYERSIATERLQKLLRAQPDSAQLAALLAAEIARPNAPFEARATLQRALSALPQPATPAAPQHLGAAEVQRLVDMLDNDSYDARQGAAVQLRLLLADGQHAGLVMQRLKQRLADPQLTSDSRGRVLPLWQSARRHWLMSPPGSWNLPAVTPQQIAGWLDTATTADLGPDRRTARRLRESALRELYDALARDELTPAIQQELERRLAGPLDIDSQLQLQKLHDMCRPGLIAECWSFESTEKGILRKQQVVQHLIIGVPQHAPMARAPTHFDRIDDKTAHCVSGNSLSADTDYPVHQAIPHPQHPGMFFHLINCRTPRLRMIYELRMTSAEAERLKELSQATCRAWLAEKRAPNRAEIQILPGLDPGELSDYVGQALNTIEDRPIDNDPNLPSAALEMCRVLLDSGGTNRVIPGLTKALAAGRLKAPKEGTLPTHFGWVLALEMTRRDPWPEADQWLAAQLERTDPLYLGGGAAPDVGATAAFLLLTKHGADPAQFQLEQALDQPLDDEDLYGYRFTGFDGRQAVIDWWKKRQTNPPARPAAVP